MTKTFTIAAAALAIAAGFAINSANAGGYGSSYNGGHDSYETVQLCKYTKWDAYEYKWIVFYAPCPTTDY